MKSAEMFDVCHSRYRGLRGELNEGAGPIRSLALEEPANGYSWRPSRGRACEYVADFERIGRYALRRPEWKGRLKLFEAYFVNGIEYRPAIRAVGVAEGTFDYWFREVKRALGAEFLRTGLFPPAQYFQARNAKLSRPVAGQAHGADVKNEAGPVEARPYLGRIAPCINGEAEQSLAP